MYLSIGFRESIEIIRVKYAFSLATILATPFAVIRRHGGGIFRQIACFGMQGVYKIRANGFGEFRSGDRRPLTSPAPVCLKIPL